MALVTMKYEMIKANRDKYAVPAFNFFTAENLIGIAAGAQAKSSPVIAMATTKGLSIMGVNATAKLCDGISRDFGINMVLHLDHCKDFDTIRKCVDAGFTSVMIDASSKEYQQNVDETARVVEYASKYGVTVESELGHVAGREDNIEVSELEALFTTPEDALRFVNETQVDCLAVAVGTVHGFYKREPKLDFDRIAKIHALIPNTPLVLHGGTGVPDADFVKAIGLGIRKINIGTELKVHGVFDTMKAGYASATEEDPRPVSKLTVAKVSQIVQEKIDVMGSAGKQD